MRTKKAFAVAVMVGMMTCLQAVGTVVYPKENESSWFDANVSAITKTDDMTTPSPWTFPADEDAVTIPQTGTISLDTDFNDPLTYTVTEGSSNVAVVVASFTVMPNDAVPDITDTPQAALTVVGNETDGTNWVGMVGDTNGYRWETFSNGPAPVIGGTHSIRIEFDQRANAPRRIRYFVDGTVLGDGWYANPQANPLKISSVSFAGSGDITALTGTNIEEKAVIEVAFKPDTPGYDFTNGCINVTVSKAPGTLHLTVVDFNDKPVEAKDIEVGIGATSIDVSELVGKALTPGGIYSYKIDVKDADGDLVATKYGAFEAAVVDSDVWFLADAAKNTVTGGHWDPALTPQDDFYVIEDDTGFILDQTGTNCVTRIDATVVFDTLVETNSLEVETEAFGGFVAVTSTANTAWMAFSCDGNNEPNWIGLTGAISPAVGVPYIVRAEVDFLSETKRVRYLVSDDAGTNFYPLANGTTQWLPFASAQNELSEVQLKGAGKLAKLEARIADKALATVGDVKYYDMTDAMAAGPDITLLTNVTVQPTKPGTWNFGTSFNVIVDMSLLQGGTYTLVDGVLTVTGPATSQGATYLIW